MNSPIIPGFKINKDEDRISVNDTLQAAGGKFDVYYVHKARHDVCYKSYK